MPRGLRCAISISISIATIVLVAPAAHAQATLTVRRDVISGQVTDDSARGLAHVDVIISRAPDRAFLRTVTDTNGHYVIVFEQGTGDYLVHVSALGMTTVRKRVTRQGSDSVFIVDVVLKREGAEQLAAVHVTARKPKPSRGSDYGLGPGTGAMEHTVDGVKGAVTPSQDGNLAAMAATVPTLLVTPNGVSAGGAGPAQNSTTLNGMSFPGADLPRDAITSVRVRTSVYDPAEGWFGGVQQAIGMGGGFPLTARHAHLTLDAPGLQYTDHYSNQIGNEFTNLNASLGGGGNVPSHETLEYDYGIEGSRRVADGISLASASDDVLERGSIAPDSAARLLGVLDALGVIGPRPAGPLQRTTNTAIFLGSIGSRERTFPTYKIAPTVWNVTGYAKASRSDNIVSSPNTTSSYSGATASDIAWLQGHVSTYIHDAYLLDAGSAVSTARTRTTPNSTLPSGMVFLESDLSDGTTGFSNVSFGGNGGLAAELTQSTWETAANIKLYPPGKATHRVAIAADSRLDRWRRANASNALGTFTFNSIEEVEQNSPTAFTRTLNAPSQSAATWNGFLSVADWWDRSDAFQLLYGLRLEGNRFLSAPAYNPAIASQFGQRTDFTPSTVHVSPRIGFTYTLRDRGGSMGSSLGNLYGGPTGYVRGGIGEFRSLLAPSLLDGIRGASGLAPSARTISCVGAATPNPTWGLYAADPSLIPTDCIGGTTQNSFVDVAPHVELLDRSYTAPRSWRANLSYGSDFHRLAFSIEGAYSLNLNQPGMTDLNFSNRPQFTTSNEERLVYVPPSAIVPGSGAFVATAARRDSSFGQVVDHVSNLRSTGEQLTFILSPDLENLHEWFASLAYTIADSRALSSGFDNSTFDSPTTRSWARSNLDVRHRLVLQGGVSKRGVTVTMFGRLQSGFPFTPMIGSDVNGDGFANDRAFIFDPALSTDPSLARGMRSLMQSSQRNVRECLARQLQRAAAVNSCEGSWTASMNAQVAYAFKFPRTRQHASMTLALMNPLGGLDQALHGIDHLHGWGTNAYPNTVLYNVRGFDPITRQYSYEVNSRFGDTRPRSGAGRAPFGLTLDFSIDLAPPVDLQVADLLLKPGRNGHPGPRIAADDIRHLYRVADPDPFLAIIQESDSLMLSRSQEEALTSADHEYAARRDTIITALTSYLTGVGDHYSTRDVVHRQDELLAALWDLGHSSIKQILPDILSRYQLKMLPWPARDFYAQPTSVKGMDLISQ